MSLCSGLGSKDKPAGIVIHKLRPYDPPELYEFYTIDRMNSITDYVLLKDGHDLRVDVDKFAVLIPYPETRASWSPDKIAAAKKSIDDASQLYPQWKQKLGALKMRWSQYEASLLKTTAPGNTSSKRIR